MDKISNKLRLVRSQSMGVGMGMSNVEKPQPVQRTLNHSEGRNAAILLLDERRLEMLIQPRLYAGELLDIVASHCQLQEKEYFGLAVVDESGHYTWLQLDRKVLDHDLPRKPEQLTIHFLVKFFIESIGHLGHNRTIELFYLQAKNLIFRGTLEVESEIVFQLAALALQASAGDFYDETVTRALIKKSPILPAHTLKEHPSLAFCEDRVVDHYKKMKGQTRGQAIVNYMSIVESMPTYGVHYFEVYDKRQAPWWLGLSCRGIAQYNYNDRKVPVRVFPWKQLENLYFRDKKFSIEVHDAKRVVQTLSSYNLFEDALNNESPSAQKDELMDAIADSTTQMSMSRRSFNPGSIHVYVWFGKTQGITKCIWQSAISQHQFYLDRKQAKMRHHGQRTLKEIARDLTQSSVSLSSSGSFSNLSCCESTSNLHNQSLSGSSSMGTLGKSEKSLNGGSKKLISQSQDQLSDQQKEEAKRARAEMVNALKARKEALESKLKEKQAQLKELCIKEGELTGKLPPEIPLAPGEPVPQIRRRVGTEFVLSENLLKKPQSEEEELVASLELEHEIQSKITSAALKLANDNTAAKSVRKQRKQSYQECQRKLREIENKLNALKYYGTKQRRKHQTRSYNGEWNQGSENNLRRNSQDISRGQFLANLANSPYKTFQGDEADGSFGGTHSCPSTPRKPPHHEKDTISLESDSTRSSRKHLPLGGEFVPSSSISKDYIMYNHPHSVARKSYISTTPKTPTEMDAHSRIATSEASGLRSKTLPTSPFQNKYETFTQCDSPIGLYNCPKQRTSQAFSSLDDIDVLNSSATRKSGSPITRRPLPPKPHHMVQPESSSVMLKSHGTTDSLLEDKSLGRNQQRRLQYNHALANRELPALPSAPLSSLNLSNSVLTRSMEDINSLEASGLHGRYKMLYKEVPVSQEVGSSEANAFIDAFNLGLSLSMNRPHQLKNTDEYPSHLSPEANGSSSRSTSSNQLLGIHPLHGCAPIPAKRASGMLLPGQTYPETTMKEHNSMASLQEPLKLDKLQPSLPNVKKLSNEPSSASSKPSGSEGKSSPPPPLYPKQYHHVVEERQRKGYLDMSPVRLSSSPDVIPVPPRCVVSESPAVNRRTKPVMSTPPAPPLPPTSSSTHLGSSNSLSHNESFDSTTSTLKNPPLTDTCTKKNIAIGPPATSSMTQPADNVVPPGSNQTLQGKFLPYRETSKPFEMTDFYKYSTKYRKQGVKPSDKSGVSPAHLDSSRSSTTSGSGSSTLGCAQSKAGGGEESEHNGDLAQDFSKEMLAWYKSTQERTASIDSQTSEDASNSATLV